MEADLEAEIPSSSRRFPTKYRLSSENFPKERWDELTAPRASIAAWNRKKANKEVHEGSLEAQGGICTHVRATLYMVGVTPPTPCFFRPPQPTG